MDFMKCYRRAFTMIELMAAMAIIAILAGLGVKGMQFAQSIQAEAATKARMEKVKVILESFKKKCGYYPQQSSAGDINLFGVVSDISGKSNLQMTPDHVDPIIESLVDDYTSLINSGEFVVGLSSVDHDQDEPTAVEPTGRVKRVSKIYFVDGLGQAFQYKCPGDRNVSSYDLWSEGADAGQNYDDITNWE